MPSGLGADIFEALLNRTEPISDSSQVLGEVWMGLPSPHWHETCVLTPGCQYRMGWGERSFRGGGILAIYGKRPWTVCYPCLHWIAGPPPHTPTDMKEFWSYLGAHFDPSPELRRCVVCKKCAVAVDSTYVAENGGGASAARRYALAVARAEAVSRRR